MRDAIDCWYLTGPTAGGKTAVGVEMARLIDAEIISIDSMAVYRGMDIGTAKPTAAERQAVPHHLIDILVPNEQFSVAQYRERALAAIEDITRRGRAALFVGGTPLYLKAMLRGIFKGPPADWDLRRRLEAEALDIGLESLHARLAQIDPLAAQRLHPNDARRIIRALEVFEQTGTQISTLQKQFDVGRPASECRVFVLEWPRAALRAYQSPRRSNVRGWLGRRDAQPHRHARPPEPHRAPSGRLSRSDRTPLRPPRSPHNHRARKNAHAPIRQAPVDLVPQLERMPQHIRCGTVRFRCSGAANCQTGSKSDGRRDACSTIRNPAAGLLVVQ